MAAARRRCAAAAHRGGLRPELVLHPLPGRGRLCPDQHRIPLQTAAAGPAGQGPGNRHRAAAARADVRARRAQVRGRRRRRVRGAARIPPHGRGPAAPGHHPGPRRRRRAGPRAAGGRRSGGARTCRADRPARAPHRIPAPERAERGRHRRRAGLRAALRRHREPQLLPHPDPRRAGHGGRVLERHQQGLQLHRRHLPGRHPAAVRAAGHPGPDPAAGTDPGPARQPAAAVADPRLVPDPGQRGRLRRCGQQRRGLIPDHAPAGGDLPRRAHHALPGPARPGHPRTGADLHRRRQRPRPCRAFAGAGEGGKRRRLPRVPGRTTAASSPPRGAPGCWPRWAGGATASPPPARPC